MKREAKEMTLKLRAAAAGAVVFAISAGNMALAQKTGGILRTMTPTARGACPSWRKRRSLREDR
jgi:hypothetical protein